MQLRYDSQKAQKLHTQILGYFVGDPRNSLKTIQKSLFSSTEDIPPVSYVSASGHNVFHDIFHLPFTPHFARYGEDEILSRVKNVFHIVTRTVTGKLEDSIQRQDLLKSLFTGKTCSGHTPLHSVVEFGNAELVALYLDTLKSTLIMNETSRMSQDELKDLLKAPISFSGLNIFHLAIKSNDLEKVSVLVRFVKENILDEPEFLHDVIHQKNHHGRSPLSYARKDSEIQPYLKEQTIITPMRSIASASAPVITQAQSSTPERSSASSSTDQIIPGWSPIPSPPASSRTPTRTRKKKNAQAAKKKKREQHAAQERQAAIQEPEKKPKTVVGKNRRDPNRLLKKHGIFAEKTMSASDSAISSDIIFQATHEKNNRPDTSPKSNQKSIEVEPDEVEERSRCMDIISYVFSFFGGSNTNSVETPRNTADKNEPGIKHNKK